MSSIEWWWEYEARFGKESASKEPDWDALYEMSYEAGLLDG